MNDTSGYLELDHRTAPQTAALGEQKKLSMGTDRRLVGGRATPRICSGFRVRSPARVQRLDANRHHRVNLRRLSQFAQAKRERHPVSRETLGRRLRDYGAKSTRPQEGITGEEMTDVEGSFGSTSRRGVVVIRKYRPPSYNLGTLDAARAGFVKAAKVSIVWLEPDEDDGENHAVAAE